LGIAWIDQTIIPQLVASIAVDFVALSGR